MFIVFLPHFDDRSGGLRMFWNLPRWLRLAGYECAATEGPIQPQPNDIVIYPDCIRGNPLNAAKVCRFFMAPASWQAHGFWGGTPIPASDLVIPFHDYVVRDVQEHYAGTLGVPLPFGCIEPGLFYPDDKTIENFLYLGKEHWKGEPKFDRRPVIVGRMSHDRCDAVALLRQSKRFYSQDHWTVMMDEALLCGCEAFYVHGETDFRRYENPHPECNVINPERDTALAKAFAERCLAFFG